MDEGTPIPADEQVSVETDPASETSLTRRKALGVGAVALGGAALGGLASVSGAEAATTVVPNAFKGALTKLATNPTFRKQALANPALITKGFPSLTTLELEALRDCAILSGANIAAINKVRASKMTSAAKSNPGAITISIGGTIGWSVSCCSCCCCCCGETAVLPR